MNNMIICKENAKTIRLQFSYKINSIYVWIQLCTQTISFLFFIFFILKELNVEQQREKKSKWGKKNTHTISAARQEIINFNNARKYLFILVFFFSYNYFIIIILFFFVLLLVFRSSKWKITEEVCFILLSEEWWKYNIVIYAQLFYNCEYKINARLHLLILRIIKTAIHEKRTTNRNVDTKIGGDRERKNLCWNIIIMINSYLKHWFIPFKDRNKTKNLFYHIILWEAQLDDYFAKKNKTIQKPYTHKVIWRIF